MSGHPPQPGVRPAGNGDLGTLVEFHQAGVRGVADSRGGELDSLLDGRGDPPAASFGDDLGSPATEVLVGTLDGVAVGYAVLRIDELSTGELLGVVRDLYVLPRARGVGVGEALMTELLDIATARGCRGLDARALPGDRETKNFFESFGLVARAIVVHRDLR